MQKHFPLDLLNINMNNLFWSFQLFCTRDSEISSQYRALLFSFLWFKQRHLGVFDSVQLSLVCSVRGERSWMFTCPTNRMFPSVSSAFPLSSIFKGILKGQNTSGHHAKRGCIKHFKTPQLSEIKNWWVCCQTHKRCLIWGAQCKNSVTALCHCHVSNI